MTSHEKSLIKNLVNSNHWKVIEIVAEALISKFQNDNPLRDSEWETLKATISQQAKIEGIRSFIQELFSNAE